MTVDYRVYGLTLRATRPLPHLPVAAAQAQSGEPDVLFTTHRAPGNEAGEQLRVRYISRIGRLALDIDPAGRQVSIDVSGTIRPATIDNVSGLLAGPILGGLLRLRGQVSLHGCVLDVASRATIFLGGRGAGKSTLAAALAERGCAVLSDDTAALFEDAEDGWTAQPGYPRLRIRAEGRREKRYRELSTEADSGPWRFQARPIAVGAIYELCRDTSVDRPSVESLGGVDRLKTLLRHTRATPAPLSAAARASELEHLGCLATQVPVSRLMVPDDLDALPEVCQAIT